MRIPVHVLPRSAKNSIEWEEGGLKVRLTASPVDGAANKALIAFVAHCLGLHKRDIQIVHGATGRHKIIEITGMTADALEQEIKARSLQ
jgi:uncharacterized protein